MLVLGDREAEERKVAPRSRSGEQLPAMPVEEFLDRVEAEAREPLSGAVRQ
ncbi:MAG: hypothetical protein ACREQ9_18650 [Candidatus Binatia bacterium]